MGAKGANAAENLLGVTLKGRWKILERVDHGDEHTGSTFSVGYRAEDLNKRGETVFIKVLNLGKILQYTPPAEFISEMARCSTKFAYEQKILTKCKSKQMQHVVLPIDDGAERIAGYEPLDVVSYIVFPLADGGDVRKLIEIGDDLDVAWALRSLHQSAVGLHELHTAGIAHRDVKPSNVMVFDKENKLCRLGDLGSATAQETPAPDDQTHGSILYSAPEIRYGHTGLDWKQGKIAGDMYMFGGLMMSMLFSLSVNAGIAERLAPAHKFGVWAGTFNELIPYLEKAHAQFMSELNEAASSRYGRLSIELCSIIHELCYPDPVNRGDSSHPAGNRYSMERYISRLDHLAKIAEFEVGRQV